MKIILVGLGNPGKKYADSYHNAGQLFIDFLAGEKAKFKKQNLFEHAEIVLNGKNLILAKTLTFMNESGPAILAILKYSNTSPQNMIIVHDDSDLEITSYKFSYDRGAAGHKGVQSAILNLKGKKFMRLRIGVRNPLPRKRLKAGDFVLRKITGKNRKKLYSVFEDIKTKLSENVNLSPEGAMAVMGN